MTHLLPEFRACLPAGVQLEGMLPLTRAAAGPPRLELEDAQGRRGVVATLVDGDLFAGTVCPSAASKVWSPSKSRISIGPATERG